MNKKRLAVITIVLFATTAASAQIKVKSRDANPSSLSKTEKRALVGIDNDARVLTVGPSTTYLKNGLTIRDVVRVLGRPTSVSRSLDGSARLIVLTFSRSEDRILVAEFREGVLVRSSIDASYGLALPRRGYASKPRVAAAATLGRRAIRNLTTASRLRPLEVLLH